MKFRTINRSVMAAALLVSLTAEAGTDPVDYVDPYIGNISHLLVPTFPTVHLPNSLLRVYPGRADYTSVTLSGLPLVVTHHRERSAFCLGVCQEAPLAPVIDYEYDNEHIRPYAYDVDISPVGFAENMTVDYAVSHQSAIYSIGFEGYGAPRLLLTSRDGAVTTDGATVSGRQRLGGNTSIYIYMEFDTAPESCGILDGSRADATRQSAEGRDVCAVVTFPEGTRTLRARYGVSLISVDQARNNLRREIRGFDIAAVAAEGRRVWNDYLSKIRVTGGSEDDKRVFYTSLYRTCERPVCLSEDGRYFSACDGRVHDDGGVPFYTDDWIWDTYRAAHPLRVILAPDREEAILESYLRMAEQMGNCWMPTFPEITGDSRRMNSNHAVASVADAVVKGLAVDTARAYDYCRRGIEEKTLAPWSGKPAGRLDAFYREHGYIPALRPGEAETDPNVHPWEKRQPVAVTLGTAYDQWCLAVIALALGRGDEAAEYALCSLNYRNIFNESTAFFHPKDEAGKWIEPFDYRYSGGQGAREYYGENNGWVYRWDVPHNVADLVSLMGGPDAFAANLDRTFAEPLGRGKYDFYSQLPDHTGNVGQFSMANEPSLHVPYLYNYAGKPWKTQKCIRKMLATWFRPDLMGVPGDEDGGGMTSFVVFSAIGLYPVTPGLPLYNIGSPLFRKSEIALPSGKSFVIEAPGASADNKYIQSATLNGKPWNKSWIPHSALIGGGKLVLRMGPRPNRDWASDPSSVPPSGMPVCLTGPTSNN